MNCLLKEEFNKICREYLLRFCEINNLDFNEANKSWSFDKQIGRPVKFNEINATMDFLSIKAAVDNGTERKDLDEWIEFCNKVKPVHGFQYPAMTFERWLVEREIIKMVGRGLKTYNPPTSK